MCVLSYIDTDPEVCFRNCSVTNQPHYTPGKQFNHNGCTHSLSIQFYIRSDEIFIIVQEIQSNHNYNKVLHFDVLMMYRPTTLPLKTIQLIVEFVYFTHLCVNVWVVSVKHVQICEFQSCQLRSLTHKKYKKMNWYRLSEIEITCPC